MELQVLIQRGRKPGKRTEGPSQTHDVANHRPTEKPGSKRRRLCSSFAQPAGGAGHHQEALAWTPQPIGGDGHQAAVRGSSLFTSVGDSFSQKKKTEEMTKSSHSLHHLVVKRSIAHQGDINTVVYIIPCWLFFRIFVLPEKALCCHLVELSSIAPSV